MQARRQSIEDGCGNTLDQTHAGNHPVTATATATRTHSKQKIEALRVAEQARTMTSTEQQHTAHSTQDLGGGVWRWFIKSRVCGVGRPGSESRPTSPQTGAGVGREATKLPRYSLSDRTSTTGPGRVGRGVLPVPADLCCAVHRRRGNERGNEGGREGKARAEEL